MLQPGTPHRVVLNPRKKKKNGNIYEEGVIEILGRVVSDACKLFTGIKRSFSNSVKVCKRRPSAAAQPTR